jgi:alkylhydroperoxidase/carboxymuconolactone decarboxylase family protein YurZ
VTSHTAAGVQQNKQARNPEIWVEAMYAVMSVHGLVRLADGLRLPLEHDESTRTPLVSIPEHADGNAVLNDVAEFFGLEKAPRVFRAMARRPLYLKTTWSFVRQTLEADLLSREQKTLLAVAVSAAAGSDYGTDFFGAEARRLDVDEEAVWETLCVVQRFAGLTKFASGLDLEPDIFPKW